MVRCIIPSSFCVPPFQTSHQLSSKISRLSQRTFKTLLTKKKMFRIIFFIPWVAFGFLLKKLYFSYDCDENQHTSERASEARKNACEWRKREKNAWWEALVFAYNIDRENQNSTILPSHSLDACVYIHLRLLASEKGMENSHTHRRKAR